MVTTDSIQIIDTPDSPSLSHEEHAWKLLVVDDEEEVHLSTQFALRKVKILGSPVEIIGAYSKKEARKLLSSTPDIAVILLDVVMENESAGLELVSVIREELGLNNVRIILRTGQPGYAPELKVLQEYDINDYRTKEELTRTRLISILTSAVRAYQNLKRVQQMERLTSVARLAAGITHEIKNPLAIILMGADYLEERLNRGDPIDAGVIREIRNAVSRASSIVSNVLDLSNATEIGREPSDIQKLIDIAVNQVNYLIEANEVILETNCGNDVPKILIDREKMEQVFVNIITNACEAMAEGGKLVITVRVEVPDENHRIRKQFPGSESFYPPGEKVVLIIFKDSGPGIPNNMHSNVFEPFVTTNRRIGGTGLGLSIVRNIVELHEGKMEIVSPPEGGTEVLIALGIDD